MSAQPTNRLRSIGCNGFFYPCQMTRYSCVDSWISGSSASESGWDNPSEYPTMIPVIVADQRTAWIVLNFDKRTLTSCFIGKRATITLELRYKTLSGSVYRIFCRRFCHDSIGFQKLPMLWGLSCLGLHMLCRLRRTQFWLLLIPKFLECLFYLKTSISSTNLITEKSVNRLEMGWIGSWKVSWPHWHRRGNGPPFCLEPVVGFMQTLINFFGGGGLGTITSFFLLVWSFITWNCQSPHPHQPTPFRNPRIPDMHPFLLPVALRTSGRLRRACWSWRTSVSRCRRKDCHSKWADEHVWPRSIWLRLQEFKGQFWYIYAIYASFDWYTTLPRLKSFFCALVC